VIVAFGTTINLNSLANYANQAKPNYILKDNTAGNTITNAKATLGRVLFYDKSLSINNSVACASCHKQQFAFGDTALVSSGVVGGVTGRHSMRLINSRFAIENKFFWDERASTLEQQTTQPIQDHNEMGFSGQTGRGTLATLLSKLQAIGYYNELFKFVYGDITVTEARLQECLAQFIRSIQSFDSKYDAGRAQVNNDNQPFPNFSTLENTGKTLFLTPPTFDLQGNRISGGLGCNGCHNAPEFDIDPNTRNNGIIGIVNATGIDINNTRAPSLRDLVNTAGMVNSPMMHTGALKTLQNVIGHYGNITIAPGNTNLDARLRPNGIGQKLQLTANDVDAVVAFLKTLAGSSVYTDVKWGNPFK
ncbi:MAG: cytochrome-c peroxidase, partial [Sphingobacteriaceae bacterium]